MLNIVMEDLLEGHPISEKKMKEVLGHTPLQVCGMSPRPLGPICTMHSCNISSDARPDPAVEVRP